MGRLSDPAFHQHERGGPNLFRKLLPASPRLSEDCAVQLAAAIPMRRFSEPDNWAAADAIPLDCSGSCRIKLAFSLRSVCFGGKSVRSDKMEDRVTSRIRASVLAAGAAALLSAQAAYAAPAPTSVSGVDPLVSLSMLGSQQSRAAVCAGSSAVAAASAAVTQGTGDCVLPITASAGVAPPPAAAEGLAPVGAAAPNAFGVWPALLGLALLIGVVAAVASGGHNGNGNLTPVSPA